MAIDYGFKTLISMYYVEFVEYIKQLGIVRVEGQVRVLGSLELVIQERPLRLDFALGVGENHKSTRRPRGR